MFRKLSKFFRSPLSNKLVAMRHVYWRAKSRLFYRFLFRSLGKNSVLYRPMLLINADCIEIGDNVSILDGVRLEAVRDPFGRTPRLTVGANTNFEQRVHIACHNRVSIGSNVSVTAGCAIVDVTHPYVGVEGKRIGDQILDEDSFVEIGDGAVLGYGSVILPNVRIGRYAMIGANSVVTHDVPDFAVAAGAPAKVLKVYSRDLQKWVAPAAAADASR